MARRLPPLNSLRAFDAASRHASFTRAAEELFVTQGAVSRHVATLETWLKVQLFARSPRGIELTPKGAVFFRSMRGALDQIEHVARQLQQKPDDKMLRLKVPPTFAIRWLVPRLALFHASAPALDVQITTSHQPVNFHREDVAARAGAAAGNAARPGEARAVVLAAPAAGLADMARCRRHSRLRRQQRHQGRELGTRLPGGDRRSRRRHCTEQLRRG